MPPIGFLPCCCGCKFCGDEKTPDYLTVTGANFIDRTLNALTAYPGRLISPLSALNRAHQLDRVFAGRIRDRLPSWGGAADACGVFYESAEYAFGDLFLGPDLVDVESNYEEESLWARDLVYKLSIGLAVIPGVPSYLLGAADGSGGTTWIGGSILPGQLYYEPTITGDVSGTEGRLTRSLICSTPSSAAIIKPYRFARRLMVYKPATLPTWHRADTSSGGPTYWPSYTYTDGDAHEPLEAEANEQTAATLDLIASAARS